MITILWLIRSNVGISEQGDETFWQYDWFISFLITIMIIMLDFMFTYIIYGLIKYH